MTYYQAVESLVSKMRYEDILLWTESNLFADSHDAIMALLDSDQTPQNVMRGIRAGLNSAIGHLIADFVTNKLSPQRMAKCVSRICDVSRTRKVYGMEAYLRALYALIDTREQKRLSVITQMAMDVEDAKYYFDEKLIEDVEKLIQQVSLSEWKIVDGASVSQKSTAGS